MALWLFKQEPDCYGFADLQRDGGTTWDGVANALAQKHLRATRPGDRVFFYHTGKEKAVVGVMRVTGGPHPDPADATGRAVVVAVEPVRALAHPVTLAAIKADPAFADWELVRVARLSVMPVTARQWARVEELSEAPPAAATPPKRAAK